MSIKKRVATIMAALVMATGVVGLGVSDAQAIGRGTCSSANYGLLWIYSDATTCWGGVGQTSVTLYNVNFLNGGSNTGWVSLSSGKIIYYYNDRQSSGTTVSPRATVTVVDITSSY